MSKFSAWIGWVGLTLGGILACSVGPAETPSSADPATGQAQVQGGAPARAAAAPLVIRITGVPDENPTELARKHRPMTDYLSKALGAEVTYVPVTDYGAAVQALVAGHIDFAWLGGFTHVQSRILGATQPLVMRDIDREFKSVVIAHVNSGVRTPRDLKGKTFAFGSKSSTSGHLMPRHFLSTEFQINPDMDFAGAPVFSGAHDATAKLVESGKVQGGALNKEVWDRMVREEKVDPTKARVVWTTPEYADYNWTARSDISEELRRKFAGAFLALDDSKAEHKVVLALQGAKQFVVASAADFDAIEGVARSTGLLVGRP